MAKRGRARGDGANGLTELITFLTIFLVGTLIIKLSPIFIQWFVGLAVLSIAATAAFGIAINLKTPSGARVITRARRRR